MKKTLLIILAFIVTNCTFAQQVETFNYADGSNIVGQGGWASITTPSPSILVSSRSLDSIGSLPAKSIRFNGTTGTAGTNTGLISLSLTTASGFTGSITDATAPLYVAYPIFVNSAPTTGNYFYCLRSPTGTSTRYLLYIKGVTDGFQLGYQIQSETPTYFTTTYSYGHKYQLVIKWAESTKQSDLYVMDSTLPDTEPSSASYTVSSTNTAKGLGRVCFAQVAGADMYVGGIIIKNSWPAIIDSGALDTKWVKLDSITGKLVYKKDTMGNKVINFSHAGYMGGGVRIPDVPVKVTLYPNADTSVDQTTNIQNAINTVASMPFINGTRGAVFLSPGNYKISQTINLNTSGVVLRGAGSTDDSDGTTINWAGAADDTCFNISGTGSYSTSNLVNITNPYVSSGIDTFTVSNASAYSVGDSVLITRTVTTDWLHFMEMDSLVRDGELQTWLSAGTKINADRVIAAISGNTITLDVPLTDSYDSTYLHTPAATMSKYTFKGRIFQVGLEHLQVKVPSSATDIYSVASMHNAKDSWMRDMVCKESNNSFVVTNRCKRITMDNLTCNNSIKNTVAAHPFVYVATGTQVLLSNSGAYGLGTWSAVAQSQGTGPIVIYNLRSTQNYGIAPHQRWTTGILSDNCRLPNSTSSNQNVGISYSNRTNLGSGHGWTTGWSVAWNVTTPYFLVSRPPGTMNWVIGGVGTKTSASDPDGIYDRFNTTVSPQSLYIQQLTERLGTTAISNLKDTTLPNDITDNGGIITAQYTGGSTEGFSNVIDNDLTTKYYVGSQTALWITYQSTKSVVVNKYSISSANDVPTRDPKNWTLYGSNNSTDWTVLDSRVDQVFGSRNLSEYFKFSNNTPYLYYKLNITANNGATATQLTEWQLFDSATVKQKQQITFPSIASKNVGDSSFNLNVSINSGLPISYSSSNTSVATVGSDGTVQVVGQGTTTITAAQAGNSVWQAADSSSQNLTVNSILPVTLLYVDATIQGTDGVLTWATATENNSSFFEIERSLDGHTFTTIKTIAAAGNSSTRINYNYIDKNITLLNVLFAYYRLKQFDDDGKSYYSKIVSIQPSSVNTGAQVQVFPNPFSTSLYVLFTNVALAGKAGNISLCSTDGKVVYQKTIGAEVVNNATALPNLPQLVPGIYILKVALGKENYSFKLIKN